MIEIVEVQLVDQDVIVYRGVKDLRMLGDLVRIEVVQDGRKVADLYPIWRISSLSQYTEEEG